MILNWDHPDGFPGVYLTEYKGHKLRIHPMGSAEMAGLIDGEVRSSYDDIEVVELELLQIIEYGRKLGEITVEEIKCR